MIVVLVILLFLVALYFLFPLIQVCGDSMYPTYFDGEILFGTRLYRKSKLNIGDVIVYKTPNENKTVIKRIIWIDKKRNVLYFYCLGDNRDNSYDSRHYGYISSKRLVCKVINQRRNCNVCN